VNPIIVFAFSLPIAYLCTKFNGSDAKAIHENGFILANRTWIDGRNHRVVQCQKCFLLGIFIMMPAYQGHLREVL